MDGARFAKLCKDTKLVDKKLTATDVDLIFNKALSPIDGFSVDIRRLTDILPSAKLVLNSLHLMPCFYA